MYKMHYIFHLFVLTEVAVIIRDEVMNFIIIILLLKSTKSNSLPLILPLPPHTFPPIPLQS